MRFIKRNPERQNTTMTLQELLVEVGVVIDVTGGGGNGNGVEAGNVDPNGGRHSNVPQHGQWMPYQLLPQQQHHSMMTMFMPGHGHHVPQPLAMSGGALPDSAYPDAQLAVSTTPLMGTVSDTQAISRKRHAPGDVVERTVERRQKRMIKNRESAARSRARKQVEFGFLFSLLLCMHSNLIF